MMHDNGRLSFAPPVDPARRTLVNIASVSRQAFNTLVGCSGHKTVECFQLEKIVVASGAIMETLNKALFVGSGTVDDRLKDWLDSEEPQICLDVLNQMVASLDLGLDHSRGIKAFFQSSRSVSTKDRSNEALKLFWKHEGYFHFLLSTDVWDRESGCQPPPAVVPPPHALRGHEAAAHQDGTRGRLQLMGGVIHSMHGPQERKMRKQGIDAKKIDGILKWLSAWSCDEIHERTLLLRQPDTCMWLPNTDAYKVWRSTENSFLWLNGKAGAGKSVLAASVIDGLQNSLQDGEVLAYFYCDFRKERSTSAAAVMRSLLSQLLQQSSRHIADPGDLFDDLVKQKGERSFADARKLARYTLRVARLLSRQPFLVLDALDECRDIDELLDSLKELNKDGARLFVTSRPLQIIKDSFLDLATISMDTMESEVSADIHLHVTRELDLHRRLRIVDHSLKDEIYRTLCEKADGMFRWVQCQLNILKRCVTVVQVRDALNDLPSDLNETYERLLLKINQDEDEGRLARRALEWLIVALQPLQLSQIMEALSIDTVRRALDRDFGPVHGHALLDTLGSLVTHDEMTDIVMLSHFSVKEYLTAGFTRIKYPAYHVNEQVAHTQVALLCICYIGVRLERSQRSSDYKASIGNTDVTRIWLGDSDIGTRSIQSHRSSLSPSEFLSLDEYVLSCGFRHLSYINPVNKQILGAIETLHSHVQRHPSGWDHMCRRSRSFGIPWPTLRHDFVLYILIVFAPALLLRSYTGHAQLNLKEGTNPLIYAADFGTIEHARFLLSKGVKLDHRGWDIHIDHRRLLPLEAAIRRGDLPLVDLYLTEGSPVPQELFVNSLGKFCILPARIVSRLLRTDEFVEWIANKSGQGLLLHALDRARYHPGHAWQPSQPDIDVIQRRIFQLGGYPSSTQFNETLLRHTVSPGILPINAMIRLRLSTGNDVHDDSSTEDTLLHHALTSSNVSPEDRLDIVQVLVDSGSNPSTCNLAGESPLHLAASKGYISIVEYLLARHVPLPPDILLSASESRQASMIRLLTDKEVDVHAIAANGDTPFHRVLACDIPVGYSAPEAELDCVKALIDTGCDPHLANANGKTPFDIAAQNGYLSIIQHLHSTLHPLLLSDILFSVVDSQSLGATAVIQFFIKKGASVHVARPNGDTLLHLTIMGSREMECLKRIKIFVNAGCNPLTRNLAGETCFHIAAKQGYISIMEYLLSLGVPVPSDIILTQIERETRSRRPPQLSAIRFIMSNGGDICVVAKNGDTLLHLAAMLYREEDVLELFKDLVDAGCNPCAANSLHETPLHIAARSGFTSVIKYFLSMNIVLPPDILLAASTSSHRRKAQLIRYLVQEGANVSTATIDGDTPLHLLLTSHGVSIDNLECVKILVDAGCDLRTRNLAGETPMHAAARGGFCDILEYCLSQGILLPHDILLASSTTTVLRFFLRNGFDLGRVSASDITELMHRALNSFDWRYDSVEFARILTSAGWDPYQKSSTGETAIQVAARNGHIHAIKFLLSQNAPLPPNVLLDAVPITKPWQEYKAVPLMRFLIRQGANVNVTGAHGDTPLHLAISCNFAPDMVSKRQERSWKLVEILLHSGSDPSARNADGQTPIDLAEAKGHSFKENFLRLVRNADAHHPRS